MPRFLTSIVLIAALALSCKSSPPSKPAAEDSASLEDLQRRTEHLLLSTCPLPPDGGTIVAYDGGVQPDMAIPWETCQKYVDCGLAIASAGNACSPLVSKKLCDDKRREARETCKLAGVQ